jgi:hypothetical protein
MTMDNELFGDPRRYYADERKLDEKDDTLLESKIRQLLTSKQTGVKNRCEQACRQANVAIREYLRSETALKLSQADRRQAVPYQVVDGIPESLAIRLGELPDPVLLLLLQKRQLLKNGEAALDFTISQYPAITMKLYHGKDVQADLRSACDFLHQILNITDSSKLPDVIREINEDVLGAYFFRVPVIQIYWMPIGLIAGILDVSIEDLSFVVLAHELAHAYTHLGLDIDGVQWKTEEFAKTSMMLVEGLAQFYTESICNKYANRQPNILNSFRKLLEKQSKPYTHFKEWKKEHVSEVVRFSMITARSNNIRSYDTFLEVMKDIEQQLPARNAQEKEKST